MWRRTSCPFCIWPLVEEEEGACPLLLLSLQHYFASRCHSLLWETAETVKQTSLPKNRWNRKRAQSVEECETWMMTGNGDILPPPCFSYAGGHHLSLQKQVRGKDSAPGKGRGATGVFHSQPLSHTLPLVRNPGGEFPHPGLKGQLSPNIP